MRQTLMTEAELWDYLAKTGHAFYSEKEFGEYLAVYANWHEIAAFFKLKYRQVIRWYKETYLRRKQGYMAENDRMFIWHEMVLRISQQKPLDFEFKNYLKYNLCQSYNQAAFTTFFYNCRSRINRSKQAPGVSPLYFIVFSDL